MRRKTPSAQIQNPAEFFVQEKRNKASRTIFGGGFTQQDAQAVGRAGGLAPQRRPAIEQQVQQAQAPVVTPITPQLPASEQLFSRDIPITVDPKVMTVLVNRIAAKEDDQ